MLLLCVCEQISEFLLSWAYVRLLRNVDTHENERTELPRQVERLAVDEERF